MSVLPVTELEKEENSLHNSSNFSGQKEIYRSYKTHLQRNHDNNPIPAFKCTSLTALELRFQSFSH